MSWLSNLFGKKEAKTEMITHPDYNRLRDTLYGVANSGYFDEYNRLGKQTWQDELMPGVREAYEAKRNPYGGGLADTPEFANLSKESRNLTSDITNQSLQARMNALNMLANLTPRPTTVYTPGEESPMAGILGGALGVGGSILGSMMGGPVGGVLGSSLFGGTKNVSPEYYKSLGGDNFSNFFQANRGTLPFYMG